jgi:hypothetical protein
VTLSKLGELSMIDVNAEHLITPIGVAAAVH